MCQYGNESVTTYRSNLGLKNMSPIHEDDVSLTADVSTKKLHNSSVATTDWMERINFMVLIECIFISQQRGGGVLPVVFLRRIVVLVKYNEVVGSNHRCELTVVRDLFPTGNESLTNLSFYIELTFFNWYWWTKKTRSVAEGQSGDQINSHLYEQTAERTGTGGPKI